MLKNAHLTAQIGIDIWHNNNYRHYTKRRVNNPLFFMKLLNIRVSINYLL